MELTSTTVWMPVYKKELSLCELASLYQTNLALGFLPRTIAGKARHRKFLIRLGMELNNASSMSYPNSVFASVSSYCNLLLSPAFYRQFTTTHLLIVQPDCWICTNRVNEFTIYDYIAPPFYPHPLAHSLENTRCIGVGVGGLSLRRCASIADALSNRRRMKFFTRKAVRSRLAASSSMFNRMRTLSRCFVVETFNHFAMYQSAASTLTSLGCNEDWIIGIYLANKLRVAKLSSAIHFGLDAYTSEFLVRLGGKMPLGLHGWSKSKERINECRDVIIATLQPGWSDFLHQFGYRFSEDNPNSLVDSMISSLS